MEVALHLVLHLLVHLHRWLVPLTEAHHQCSKMDLIHMLPLMWEDHRQTRCHHMEHNHLHIMVPLQDLHMVALPMEPHHQDPHTTALPMVVPLIVFPQDHHMEVCHHHTAPPRPTLEALPPCHRQHLLAFIVDLEVMVQQPHPHTRVVMLLHPKYNPVVMLRDPLQLPMAEPHLPTLEDMVHHHLQGNPMDHHHHNKAVMVTHHLEVTMVVDTKDTTHPQEDMLLKPHRRHSLPQE